MLTLKKFLPVALISISQSLLAAQLPTAGSQLQQIPTIPVPQTTLHEIRIDQGTQSNAATSDKTEITVNSIHISGNHIYTEATLLGVTGFTSTRIFHLNDLREMARKITDYYHSHGYFVAQAFLAAQDIQDGSITITVLEGKYGKVSLNNQTNVKDYIAYDLLKDVKSGNTIEIDPLESSLLLLSDLPGVNIKSTLMPGSSVGTTDLLVDILPGQSITGSVFADNYGNRYTGEYRVGGTINFNELTGHGDVLSVGGFTGIDGLYFGRIGYEAQIGRARAGIAYSRIQYHLLKEFKDLKANGNEDIYSIYGSYPLIRSRKTNLFAHVGFDHKDFQDNIDTIPSTTNKQINVGSVSLIGDHRDNWLGGGFNTYSGTLTHGNLDIQSSDALAADQLGARTNGDFDKFSFTASRLQNVTETFSLYGKVQGQVASKNLDISEKMELGGAYGVRAYPEGEAFADDGYLLNLEARMLLPKWSDRIPGRMQLIGFVDTGSVTVNHNNYGLQDNHRTLSGAGVGLDWWDNNNFQVRVSYAFKLGNEKAISAPDESGRLWAQVVKLF